MVPHELNPAEQRKRRVLSFAADLRVGTFSVRKRDGRYYIVRRDGSEEEISRAEYERLINPDWHEAFAEILEETAARFVPPLSASRLGAYTRSGCRSCPS
jgi:hypothetical protein